jgi:spermidine synthase
LLKNEGGFGTLYVFDQDGMRYLRFDSDANQSMMSLSDPLNLSSIPLGYMLAPFFWQEAAPSNVLIAGVGGGDLIRFFRNSLPNVKLTAIERDELAIKLAQAYFYVDRQDAHFIIGDAFCTLENLLNSSNKCIIS